MPSHINSNTYSSTVTPIERHVPLIISTAASNVVALRSGIFLFAISSTCAFVIVPTFVLFGTAEPFGMFSAFFINTGAGGVFVMNEKEQPNK